MIGFDYQLHSLCALLPSMSEAELQALAEDIKTNGQLEPIVVYKGKILDGRNRYCACEIANVKPLTIEFSPTETHRTPEQYVLSQNVLRRHLTQGQKATIAVDWAEHIEKEGGFFPRVEKTSGKQGGRPKTSALQQTARMLGVSNGAAYEARKIKQANLALFQDVKHGACSLGEALEQLQHAQQSAGYGSDPQEVETAMLSPSGICDNEKPGIDPKPMESEFTEALERIQKVCSNRFYNSVRRRNLFSDENDLIAFADLPDDQMRRLEKDIQDGLSLEEALNEEAKYMTVTKGVQVEPLIAKGALRSKATKSEADELKPSSRIRQLHDRAVRNSGRYRCTINGYEHVVARSKEAKAELEKRLGSWRPTEVRALPVTEK
jgi:hypothetical protein